jgi:nucleotide-binding universal stress UspA family protein
MTLMKTILFPTDFSDNANNALEVAMEIAERSKANLVLFNAFWVPVYQFDNPAEITVKEKRFRNTSLEELKELEKMMKAAHPNLNTEVKTKNGFTADAITDIAEEAQADLIVMGTAGASGLKEKIMGSNTVDVINKATRPVLAVPTKCSTANFDKIAFASNYEKDEPEEIAFLVKIAKLFNSEIVIVHVGNDDFNIGESDQVLLSRLKTEVIVNTHYPKLKYEVLKGNVVEELDDFISKTNVGLISMVTSKKHFLSKIFTKSYTQKMAFHSHIPLLAMHRQGE